MNERIKDLKEQALIWSVETLDPDALNDNEWGVAIDEKFAELIVREVLAVQEQFIAEGHNAWHLNKPTKNHFGISE
jgi:hypothetical protein